MPVPTERLPRRLAALVLATQCATAFAQPPWPSAEDIARARRETPFPTTEQLRAQAIPRPPVIEAAQPGLDLEALARDGARVRETATAPTRTIRLRIFVTLALPKATLQRLAEQAERTGAVLVLRGLKANSMRQTVAAVQAIVGERRVGWLIDPEAFTRHGVSHAPTFVLSLSGATDTTPCNSAACTSDPKVLTLAGDVSLDYALEVIQRRRPDATAVIAPLLQRLRGS